MRKGLMALVASMEEEELLAGVDGDATDAEQIVDNSQLETELVDAAETEEEIKEDDATLDNTEQALDSMESLIESLEVISENGGLDRNGAVMLNHARSSIYQQLGIEFDQSRYASLESFGSTSSRQSATVIALEEEKNVFRKAIDAVIKFVKDMVKKISDFLAQYLTASGRAVRRANQLKAGAKSAKYGGKLTEAQAKKFAKAFSKDGKMTKVTDVVSEANKQIRNLSADRVIKKITDLASETVTEAVREAKTDGVITKVINWFGEKFNTFIVAINPSLGLSGTNYETFKKYWDKGSEGDYFITKRFPGERAFGMWVNKATGKEEETTGIGNFSFYFGPVADIPESAQYPDSAMPKDHGDVIKICDGVLNVCKAQQEMSGVIKRYCDLYSALFDKIGQANTSISEKAGSAWRRIVFVVRNLFRSATRPFTQVSKYCVFLSKLCLDCCAISMSGKNSGENKK